MLNVSSVTKKFSKVIANDNVSFKVDKGEIAVLLGPNGAGKSTIIKCITGLLRFSGEITLDGYNNKSLESHTQSGSHTCVVHRRN